MPRTLAEFSSHGVRAGPTNAELLDGTIAAIGLTKRRCAIRVACSNPDGIARFAVGYRAESKIAEKGRLERGRGPDGGCTRRVPER
jgi:hypothetical protein